MIPKILHAFWGGDEPPEAICGFWLKWQELHPDYVFNLWTPDNLPVLRNQQLYDDVLRVSRKSNIWQYRSDIARYELLYDYGGVWIDADLEPLRRIDDLLGCDAFTARESERFVNCGFMGSVRRGAFIHDVLSRVRPRTLDMPNARSNRQVGPHLITETVSRHPEVHIVPRELVYPYNWDDLDWDGSHDPEAYTVHHWNHRRNLDGKPL